jgi:amidohydrolase
MAESFGEVVPTRVEKIKSPAEELLDSVKMQARENFEEIQGVYNTIHENPEVGGEEFETAKLIKDFLQNLGVEIVGENIGGTGIVARISGNAGPTIALRADMDALLQQENEANFPKSKKEGVMHACGHDANTAALLGAAKILKNLADTQKLDGNVILLFQPNEDKAVKNKSGAVEMVRFLEKSGLRQEIKAFFGQHVFSPLERGQILLADDMQMAGSGFFDLKVRAKGGHGSEAKILPDLDFILSDIKIKVSQAMEKYWEEDSAVVESMGPKISKPVADNTLLSEGGRTWILRIKSPEFKNISEEAYAEIRRIITESINDHVAAVKGRAELKGLPTDGENMTVEVEMKIRPNYRPVFHRDENLVKLADQSAGQSLDKYQRINQGIMGSEDFSFYLESFRDRQIDGVFVLVGAANSAAGYEKAAHHSPDFRFDPAALSDMSTLHTMFTLNCLEYLKNKKNIN